MASTRESRGPHLGDESPGDGHGRPYRACGQMRMDEAKKSHNHPLLPSHPRRRTVARRPAPRLASPCPRATSTPITPSGQDARGAWVSAAGTHGQIAEVRCHPVPAAGTFRPKGAGAGTAARDCTAACRGQGRLRPRVQGNHAATPGPMHERRGACREGSAIGPISGADPTCCSWQDCPPSGRGIPGRARQRSGRYPRSVAGTLGGFPHQA